jgi:hypothetical protein
MSTRSSTTRASPWQRWLTGQQRLSLSSTTRSKRVPRLIGPTPHGMTPPELGDCEHVRTNGRGHEAAAFLSETGRFRM